jgi:ribosomal protein S18 acetylase RimI-like enzyme
VVDPVFRRRTAAEARAIRASVARIHREAYADLIAAGDPFAGEEAFLRRFDAHSTRPDFDMVVAEAGGELVGQAWGWPLGEHSGEAWWRGLVREPEPGFTREDGTRTFAVAELMVSRAWCGRGIAHGLLDTLLAARPETRATLLVRPGNATAYRAYTRWGWRAVGRLRPHLAPGPIMDVLVLPLAGAR